MRLWKIHQRVLAMERFCIILSRNTSCTDNDHVNGSDA